ncbi:P-loop containing nucleoside triphosphate hydrolase protein [Microdochium trichocladiopsis]|uniref:P-loop containing nucleoside triphosphate hydrolase protein n=1 Tax=Microdochium trichocladiopsis TaxID=1682393 RepID=A0A9P9BTJ6_9PEZI|nr:P-loop containing nucleoside triphosphate hydrolase protein [Microdochium trichocladiopsis]KAH7035567.1 P-loop containing nucleoside triphosphate hydrolase protein [Microdochium trichocladiopsis]
MKKIEDFKVRPQVNDTQKDWNHKHAAKIFIHNSVFMSSGFTTGHLCNVECGDIFRQAVAWPNLDKQHGPNVAGVSRAFQRSSGLRLDTTTRIVPGAGPVPDAGLVIVRDVTADAAPLTAQEQIRWQVALELRLETADYIFPGMEFEEIVLRGTKRSFSVLSINSATDGVAKFHPIETVVEFAGEDEASAATARLQISSVPGLQRQVDELNWLFEDFNTDYEDATIPLQPYGIVIHGSRGTGKSLLLDRIASSKWGRVVRLDEESKAPAVRDHFKTAVESRSPTTILIDDIGELIGKGKTSQKAFVAALAQGLDDLAARAHQTRTKPKVLVVATCLDYITDIPEELQRENRFREHISLPVPDATGRKEILASWSPPFNQETFDSQIAALGDRTHAYTAADLSKLLYRAARATRHRTGGRKVHISEADVKQALREVQPSAMHDINLKPPTVRWSDIGGYNDVKLALQRVLQRPANMTTNLWKPSKGILLYGPPGCSKTMTAQAMATESGFNFFAVKGGELLNMYVGETERSIRNLFRRAKDASPSIIFFDEIDSIAGPSRSSGNPSASSGGVQALTTLLTEMDGFEKMGDVFVLAATNKPDSLDPALVRPGRFDQAIYVPLPDAPAREAIFANKARELRFSSSSSSPSSSSLDATATVTTTDDATAPTTAMQTPPADQPATQSTTSAATAAASIVTPAPAANPGPGGLDLAELARQTQGYSGAEIAGICDKAFCGKYGPQSAEPMEVLRAAIRDTPRGVTQDILMQFETWRMLRR